MNLTIVSNANSLRANPFHIVHSSLKDLIAMTQCETRDPEASNWTLTQSLEVEAFAAFRICFFLGKRLIL